MTTKKGLQDFDANIKKAGSAIGQFLARSQAKLEKTGRQAIKTASELVETVTKTAEKTVESTVEKIHTATAGDDAAKIPVPPGLRPIKNKPIGESVRLLGDDIISHLTANGKCSLEELVTVLEKQRRNPGMIFAAIGWLTGGDKVQVTKDGKNISLK